MFVPIVVCQFFYMPFVAVPAWHTPIWTTDLEVDKTALYPSVVIATEGYALAEGPAVTLSYPGCRVHNATDRVEADCVTSDVQYAHWLRGHYQYITFNSKGQANAIGTTDIASPVAALALSVNMNCKSKSLGKESVMSWRLT